MQKVVKLADMGNRGDLTNEQWERLEPLLPKAKTKRGRPAQEHRQLLNGILWVLRTGAPWRDMPERYGKWTTIYSRFQRWLVSLVYGRKRRKSKWDILAIVTLFGLSAGMGVAACGGRSQPPTSVDPRVQSLRRAGLPCAEERFAES